LRRASHGKWKDILRFPLGRRAFRCRDCRFRFYAVPGDVSDAATDPATKRAKGVHKQHSKRGRFRIRAWMWEALIFGVMLLLFWAFLHYLTSERPASPEGRVLTAPATTPYLFIADIFRGLQGDAMATLLS